MAPLELCATPKWDNNCVTWPLLYLTLIETWHVFSFLFSLSKLCVYSSGTLIVSRVWHFNTPKVYTCTVAASQIIGTNWQKKQVGTSFLELLVVLPSCTSCTMEYIEWTTVSLFFLSRLLCLIFRCAVFLYLKVDSGIVLHEASIKQIQNLLRKSNSS